MASKAYKKLFAIRFFSYAASIVGFLVLIGQVFPVFNFEVKYRFDTLLGVKHSLPQEVVTSQGVTTIEPSPTPESQQGGGGFGAVSSGSSNTIKPVSTDYGIVIEKINANAKVVADVDPGNQKEYTKALTMGVAEAKGSTNPGEDGNLFIFSHSTDAPWNITRFNAIFYLLRELEDGDRINIFYEGRRYQYVVFDKTVIKPTNLEFLTNRYDKPVLTLQTCDPPGTVSNRLIVRAQLLGS